MARLKYKISIRKESRGGPVIVLVHGLGMTEGIWTEPFKGRLLGGLLPFRFILTDIHNRPLPISLGFHDSEPKRKVRGVTLSKPLEDLPDPPEPLWRYLQNQGYDLVTWTQRRPSGPIEEAVEELDNILKIVKKRLPRRNFVLIGHSRGGLIARRYLDRFYRYKGDIVGLITLSSPHQGSSLASFGKALSPIIKTLAILLPDDIGMVKRESLSRAESIIKRIKELSKGEAISELYPNSEFLRKLNAEKINGIYCATFGGTNPTFTRLYLLEYDKTSYIKKKGSFEWRVVSRELFSIPDILLRIAPIGFIPDELRPGKGDGLVSIKSAHIEWADEKHNLPVNHASILVDPEVKERVLQILRRFINN